MLTNPVDKMDRILKIVENELRMCDLNHNSIDSSPVLEMIRDELVELKAEVNDVGSVTSLVRRCKAYMNYRQADGLVKAKPRSPARQVLSKIVIAMREEENRYDNKTYTYWMSPVWRVLNEARGVLTNELRK